MCARWNRSRNRVDCRAAAASPSRVSWPFATSSDHRAHRFTLGLAMKPFDFIMCIARNSIECNTHRTETAKRRTTVSVNVLYRTSAKATGGRDGQAATLDGTLNVKLATPKE